MKIIIFCKLIWRKVFQETKFFSILTSHSVEKREIHCHANFFRQTNLLIWRNFCEKTVAVKFRNFYRLHLHTVWKTKKFSLTKFFLWNQLFSYLVTTLVNTILSQKYCQKKCEGEFLVFPHCVALVDVN